MSQSASAGTRVSIPVRLHTRSTSCSKGASASFANAWDAPPSFTTRARAVQQVAEEIGTVRELVVRGLRARRLQGAIETTGNGRYLVRDESLLRQIAGVASRGSSTADLPDC